MENRQNHGLNLKRLKNTDAYLQRIVDQGRAAGAAGMIVRRGETAYCSSFGMRDREKKAPLKNDSIYRIYSMSKTFTIVAAMTLYEKGLFTLRQPIADFLPAYKDVKTAVHDERGIVSVVPAKNPITFEHLFTMTSGIPYPGDGSYSARIMAELQKKSIRDAARGKPWDTARTVDETAAVPLCFHPGEYWLYGFSHDILGRLIEVISGRKLGQFLSETIFEPLGLKDTAFYVPKEKQDRLVKPYRLGSKGLEETSAGDLDSVPALPDPPAFESGGGGLCSTLADCARYAGMLLCDGKPPASGKSGKERILSRKTIELIRSKHCIPSEMASRLSAEITGYGYGLGVRTMLNPAAAGLNGSVGEWAWDGLMGTYYLIDPAEELVALFFTQLLSDINGELQRGFVQTVYGAIDD